MRFASSKPATLPHPDLLVNITQPGNFARIKLFIPRGLRMLAVVLLIFALMRPQHGYLSDVSNRWGVDIMVALDISSSMTAEDFSPNRVTVAKKVLADFIGGRTSDRIGLVVFGSQSYLQCPLTGDHRTLLSFLDNVQVGLAEDGTAIGMALASAVKSLKSSQARSKLIFLLTDGDNNSGAVDPGTAAKLAATYGIKIYAIGIGNPAGAPIPVIDPFGRKDYARNPDGSVFLTRLNADGLRKIAEVSGGSYYVASDAGKLSRIFHEIDRMEKSRFNAKTPYIFDEKYALFALPALLLLLLEFFVTRLWVRSLP